MWNLTRFLERMKNLDFIHRFPEAFRMWQAHHSRRHGPLWYDQSCHCGIKGRCLRPDLHGRHDTGRSCRNCLTLGRPALIQPLIYYLIQPLNHFFLNPGFTHITFFYQQSASGGQFRGFGFFASVWPGLVWIAGMTSGNRWCGWFPSRIAQGV